MARRRADELLEEAKRLEAQARSVLREEQIRERKDDDHRCRLLGRALMLDMKTDESLRTRYRIKMAGYCKGARDRRVFSLDEPANWFDSHAAAATAQATSGMKRSASSPSGPSSKQALPAAAVSAAATPETVRAVGSSHHAVETTRKSARASSVGGVALAAVRSGSAAPSSAVPSSGAAAAGSSAGLPASVTAGSAATPRPVPTADAAQGGAS